MRTLLVSLFGLPVLVPALSIVVAVIAYELCYQIRDA